MKLDKETFVKHHFWYLLGILVPLIFLALFLLWSGTAGAIEENQKKLEDKKKLLEGIAGQKILPNSKWIAELDKREKAALSQRDAIWKAMWEAQADLVTFPPVLAKHKDGYFGEKMDPRDRLQYAATDDQYKAQLEPVIQLVEPVDAQGRGVVQHNPKEKDWYGQLRVILEWRGETPNTEEIWLAQEDLWVKRELLRAVRQANDSVAVFKRQQPAPKPDKSKGEFDRQVFTNPTWKMEVAAASREGKGILRLRLTNISRRRQEVRVDFDVSFRGTQATERVVIDGEPLAPGASLEKEVPLTLSAQLGNAEGVAGVRQIFDWRTAPVKRVDQLAIGYHCPRTAAQALKAYPFLELKGDPKQGVMTESEYTDEGLRRKRYSEISPEVRRMPVAIVVIVDQSNIQDFLSAFASSKLQVQTTQWHWERYRGEIRPKGLPTLASKRSPGAGGRPQPPPPPAAGGGDDEYIEGPRGVGRPGARPGGRPGTPRPASPAAPAIPSAPGAPRSYEDKEYELVQLTVYGIASLYERFPPNPRVKATAAPFAPAAVKKPAKGERSPGD